MSYKLYGSPGTASMCVHWMLIELGVPFEFVSLDFEKGDQKRPDYLKINPTGHVPALVIDGVAYGEAAALLTILAERHPEAALMPSVDAPERPHYMQWMFYFANTLMPAYRLWFYADEGAGPENVEATKAQARIRIERVWDRAEGLRWTPLYDGQPSLHGGFPCGHACALVPQHAQDGDGLAASRRLCEVAARFAELSANTRARRPYGLDLGCKMPRLAFVRVGGDKPSPCQYKSKSAA